MVTIGLVTYNDVIDKSEDALDMYQIVKHLITTINTFTTDEYVLIVVDNGSLDYRFKFLDRVLKAEFSNINIVFVHNSENSLTTAWNLIVDMGINTFKCDGVILLNQDIILTKHWMPFVKAIQIQSNDVIAPMSNGACYQPLQEVSDDDFIPQDIILETLAVQGFCFGASSKCFKNNMYNAVSYFDPGFAWDYNEEEFQQRNNAHGGRSLILKNAFVLHLDQGSWLKAGLRSKNTLNYKYTGRERKHILTEIELKYTVYYNCIL